MTEQQINADRDRARAYYYKNRERILQAGFSKRRANPKWQEYQAKKNEEYKARQKAKWRKGTVEWKLVNWKHYRATLMLRSAKVRARKLGLPFNLTIEDCAIPDVCPVFGVPLVIDSKFHGGLKWSAQLDRIKPELGYVKGNVIVVSGLANRIKSEATPEQIAQVAEFYQRLYTGLRRVTGEVLDERRVLM